jgi:hypothetical protein
VGGGCPAGWGRKFPIGDPLTPGGGLGRAELRLEEEPKEEGAKEEAEEGETEGKGVSEAPSSATGGWEIFGHLLVEDLQAPGRVSVMRCVRCGASAPLTGLKALKEMPCTPKEVVRAEKLTKKCENRGGRLRQHFATSALTPLRNTRRLPDPLRSGDLEA